MVRVRRSSSRQSSIVARLEEHPIIAAVRDLDDVGRAIASPVRVIFLMTGDIFTVEATVRDFRAADKAVVVHIDLLKGLASDKEGILYLCEVIKPDGMVSTKSHLLQTAQKVGLATIQHLFVIDTQAFDTGLRHVREFNADAIELMPGLMPRVIRDLKQATDKPILAAGLIKSFAEVQTALDAGATAAVVGKRELWELELV